MKRTELEAFIKKQEDRNGELRNRSGYIGRVGSRVDTHLENTGHVESGQSGKQNLVRYSACG
jgi:hypothetical protein